VPLVNSPEAIQEDFCQFQPRNLEQERTLRLGILAVEELELPALDWSQWQHDADVLLQTLGNLSFDFGPLAGNSFQPTDEETPLLEWCSLHEKKVLNAHEQFIRMLCTHKATEAFANYDASYDYQFCRIFQGNKTTAERKAVNNIFGLWSELFYHRLNCKPYQPW
jgi:hypothetical protein